MSSVMTGLCAVAIVFAPRPCTWSHTSANFTGSTTLSHGDRAWYMNIAMPSAQKPGSNSATLCITLPGIGHANESTPQYTPVLLSSRPRVVGES